MDKKETVIADEVQIEILIAAMADSVLTQCQNLENLVFVGILSAGFPLAQRLANHIKKKTGKSVPIGKLDVGLYRDDLGTNEKFVTLRESDIPINLQSKHVILVDDVLFHGRTVRAALDGLRDYGRPEIIEVAVLVERGHRQLPIHANYIGKTMKTKKSDHVAVRLLEIDGEDTILLS